jgi:threonine synthase
MEMEGIYAEPAGAAALAGLLHSLRTGEVAKTESAVCVVSGHGFKDPDAAAAVASRHPSTTVDAAGLEEALG